MSAFEVVQQFADQNENLLNMVSALAALGATVAAAVAIFQTLRSGNETARQRRPYFQFSHPTIVQTEDHYQFYWVMTNAGTHAAKEIRIRIDCWELSGAHLQLGDYTSANDVVSNVPQDVTSKQLKDFPEIPTVLLLLRLDYKDAVNDAAFPTQKVFMKWEGKRLHGSFGRFLHASVEEANKMETLLAKMTPRFPKVI